MSDIKHGIQYIRDLDLSMVAKKVAMQTGWLSSEINKSCQQYKEYLILKLKYPNTTLPPSVEIDEVWHQHILDTKKYKLDCNNIFGFYLDHYPYFGIDGKTNMRDLDAAFKTTLKLYQKEFNKNLERTCYPTIFRWLLKLCGEK